jgi:DNA polymerase-3 subunit epsilon
MKVLILNTKATGYFDYKKPADADCQPRIAQIAMYLIEVSDDWTDRALLAGSIVFIRPDGWTMPTEAAETLAHGLTQETLVSTGVPIAQALADFNELHDQCDLIAGFNVDYDLKLIRGELRRLGLPDRYAERPVFCAMRAATGVCQIPKAKGGGYKFPKLSEAVGLFGGRVVVPHDAEADAKTIILLITELRKRGVEIVGKEQPKKLQEAA